MSTPKPFVFVLMPFDTSFDDIYHLGIKKACENAQANAERLDDQIFTENMLQRIYEQISNAEIIVADMTGRNPNVFYEVGYAHALDKIVILITQNKEDIPFDLLHYPHIVYGGKITELIPQLETKVRWAIKQAESRSRSRISTDVQADKTVKKQDEFCLKDSAYWLRDDQGNIKEGPFCMKCKDVDSVKCRLVAMEKEPQVKCPNCKNEFASKPLFDYLRPEVEQNRQKLMQMIRNQNPITDWNPFDY